MRKLVLFLATVIFSLYMVDAAYAGDLNEHEQAIIEAAYESYEYKGKFYKADQKYIDKLVDYLSQDDIDITAGDKDIIIQIAYDNIELGVRDGYLKPIDDMITRGEHNDTGKEPNPEDTVKEILSSAGKDISDIEGFISSIANNIIDQEAEVINMIGPETADSNSSPDINKEVTMDLVINDTQRAMDTDNSLDTSYTIKGFSVTDDRNSIEDEVITQTGFDLNRSLYIMIGLGTLMIIGIYITKRYKYFNNAYE